MATGVGLTFPFFCAASAPFTATHLLAIFLLRSQYMEGALVQLSPALAAELGRMQSALRSEDRLLASFGGATNGLWIFSVGERALL